MTPININAAADALYTAWREDHTFAMLDDGCRPQSPEDGYAIQGAVADRLGEPRAGWKIAATAEAGRQHINVDRPLGGRLHAAIVHRDGAQIPFGANRMAVAEAEIVLILGAALPPRRAAYTEADVAAAVSGISPGLEFPDSRFTDFTQVGTACLVADNACAREFVLGDGVTDDVNPSTLAALADLETSLQINGEVVTRGHGKDALGGPLPALTWLANTLSDLGIGLGQGEFVTTGVTGKPSAVRPGDHVLADLGTIGTVSARLTS